MNKIYIIGAGGVGSWLAPAMCKLKGGENVIIVDGDVLELKNLDRQLYDEDEIGNFKSSMLGLRCDCESIDQYYSHGTIDLDENDWLLCCVDNNAGRMSVLQSCDAHGCKSIFGANETHSAEAFYYDPCWMNSPQDPRKYYPEMATDSRNDPRRAAIGCTGEAQEANRQLVSANFMAAALMQHLFVLWNMGRRGFGKEALPYVPYHIRQNLTAYEIKRSIDNKPKE